jgi:hypothetical protein
VYALTLCVHVRCAGVLADKEATLNGMTKKLVHQTSTAGEVDTENDPRKPTKKNVVNAIRDPMKLKHLRTAAMKQGLKEGIDFAVEAERYKLLFSEADRKPRAAAMYKMYVMPGADMPINIPDTMSQKIIKKWEKAEEDLFEEANQEVLKVITDNIFNDFLAEMDKAAKAAEAPPPAEAKTPPPPSGGCCVLM